MIRFHMEWQEAPGVADAVLARTWCRLVIEAGGRLVTEAVRDGPSKSLRGGVYGAAFPLCQWLVENWWFLLNEAYRFPARYSSPELARSPQDREWVQRHSLLAAQEGFALPDLMLYRDAQHVVARWLPDRGIQLRPALRFCAEGEARMDVAGAQHGLTDAVRTVLDRLNGINAPEVATLRADWAAIEYATEQERQLCEWSARLGLDPYDPHELTDELETTLHASVAALDAPIREDLLSAAHADALPRDLNWLNSAEELASTAGRGRPSQEVPCNAEPKAAHRFGYDCASALRQRLLPMRLRDPIADLDDLLLELGWAQQPSHSLTLETESALEAALTRSSEGAPVAVVADARRDSTRFRLARSAFLHHFTPSGRQHRRLVTEAHTWDQRASRAFAAEFLAPAAGLAENLGRRITPTRIDELASHYGVSSQAIGHQIENHRLGWPSDS